MRLAGFVLKVECVDEMCWIGVDLFLRNSLCNNTDVIGDVRNVVFARQFLVHLVIVRFENSYRSFLAFVLELCFLG